MIISFILLETDSVIIQASLVVMVTKVPTPPSHFSCIQNNYKYMKVSLMIFANTRKCHGDVIKSKKGDEPHDSVRKGSWSTKQLRCRPNIWKALNSTGNKAKWDYLLLYKILKISWTKKTPAEQVSKRQGGVQNMQSIYYLLFHSVQQLDMRYWTSYWNYCSFLLRDFSFVYYKCTFIGSK